MSIAAGAEMDRSRIAVLLEQLDEDLEALTDRLERADELAVEGGERSSISAAVREAIDRADGSRQLLRGLLDAVGEGGRSGRPIEEALDAMAARYRALEDWEVVLELGDDLEGLDASTADAVYEVVADAFEHFTRRTGIDGVAVELEHRGDRLRVTVADIGAAGRPGLEDPGEQLRQARETVRSAGGEFALQTSWGSGTEIELTLDLEGRADES